MTISNLPRFAQAAFMCSLLGVTIWTTGCGGSSNGSSTTAVSKIKQRVFVSNTFAGTNASSTYRLEIADAALDRVSGYTISADNEPTTLLLSPDKKTTVVYGRGGGTLTSVTNSTEQSVTSVSLGGLSDSIVLAPDNKTAYATVRNYINSSGAPGVVQVVNYSAGTLSSTIVVPNARWLALDHAGKNLLVFSDTSDAITVIDLTVSPATTSTLTNSNFARPVAAYFSSDDSKVYVLSCGPECGSANPAAVTEVTLATKAVRSTPVAAATTGLLQGTTLYIAGAPGGTGGTFQTIDTNTMTPSQPVNIGSGYHTILQLAGNKVWIGANNCQGGGCLSLVDAQSGAVKVDNPAAGASLKGNVTGMTFLDFRNVMYVAEGGELRAYDTSGNELTTPLLDITGQAWDVVYVPQ